MATLAIVFGIFDETDLFFMKLGHGGQAVFALPNSCHQLTGRNRKIASVRFQQQRLNAIIILTESSSKIMVVYGIIKPISHHVAGDLNGINKARCIAVSTFKIERHFYAAHIIRIIEAISKGIILLR